MERTLGALDPLAGQHEVLDDQVVGDGGRYDDQFLLAPVRLCRGMQQPGLERLELAAVAASALQVQEEIGPAQQLGDVRLERDEVGGVFHLPANGDGAGDVLLDEPERTAVEVAAGRDDRRTDADIVHHERLHHPVGVALVIRRVDDPLGPRRRTDDIDSLADAIDLAKQGVERMLQRAVYPVALRGSKLFEVAVNGGVRLIPRLSSATVEIPDHFVAGEHGLRDLVLRHGQHYSTGMNGLGLPGLLLHGHADGP